LRAGGANTRRRRLAAVLTVLVAFGLVACGGPEALRYELTGQIVALDTDKRELTVAHDAVPGYMGAMTMPFKVPEGSTLLQGLVAGDVIRGRLVVAGEDGVLQAVEKIGHRELPVTMGPGSGAGETLLLEGDAVPDIELTDQHGRRRSLYGTPPTALVVTFVYTRCPFSTFCPLMDRQFTELQKRIVGDARLSGRVRLLSITLDPSQDTPDVLRRHAERLGARSDVWSFLTGDERRVRTLASRFGISTSRDEKDAAVIVHSLATIVIDSGGSVARIYRGNDWRPAEIVPLLVSMTGERRRVER
jgi:protein SCO1